ncbi:hypothetical protein ACVWXO_001119 [Bradyrhizobium sp. LM2.7]
MTRCMRPASAIEEGIVLGSGVALLRASEQLKGLRTAPKASGSHRSVAPSNHSVRKEAEELFARHHQAGQGGKSAVEKRIAVFNLRGDTMP